MGYLKLPEKLNHQVLLLSAIFIAIVFCLSQLLTIKGITYFISDDAYYYFLTAYNLVQGGGPTFDGQNLTNGFHPQWMLILLPVYKLAGNLEDSIRLVFLVQGILNAVTLALIYLWLRRMFTRFIAVNGIILLFCFYSPLILMFNGLESALLLFWLSLVVYLSSVYDLLNPNASLGRRILLGAILAGLFTARLDTAFILIALAVMKLIWPGGTRNKSYILRLVSTYIPTLTTFIFLSMPYFVWNYLNFEHLTPISGSIKSTFPSIMLDNDIGSHSIPYLIPFIVIVVFMAYSFVFNRQKYNNDFQSEEENDKGTMMIVAVTFGCVIHLLWTKMFMLFGTYQWHFVMYIVPIIYFISLFTEYFISKGLGHSKAMMRLVLSISIVIVITYNAIIHIEKGQHHNYRLHAAEWVKSSIPHGLGISLSDAGVFAYFNDRKTMNIDGLINSYEFQQAVISNNLLQFFEQQSIMYMADAYTKCDKDEHHVMVYGWRGKNFPQINGYRFTFQQSDAVYKSDPFAYRPLTRNKIRCFSIWSLKDAKVTRITP